jgi:hypothetical protein
MADFTNLQLATIFNSILLEWRYLLPIHPGVNADDFGGGV